MNARDLVKNHVLQEATYQVNSFIEQGIFEPEKNFDGKFNCKRALREAGWVWDDSGEYFFNEKSSATSFAEHHRDLCEDAGLIPVQHFMLPLEYHSVSKTLAEELINRRETVLSQEGSETFFWGRMDSGRGIHLDPIIRSIAELMECSVTRYVDDAEDTDLDAEDEPVEEETPVEEVGLEEALA
jgi:hypothetical protein